MKTLTALTLFLTLVFFVICFMLIKRLLSKKKRNSLNDFNPNKGKDQDYHDTHSEMGDG
jgi:preprotein translocase subunit SecG